MRKILPLLVLMLPTAALAHVGHLEQADGHDHYIAAWGLIGAIAGSGWLVWSELRRPKDEKPKRRKDGGAGA
jgi:hypothetical protein